MSARLVKRRDGCGDVRQFWMVDVDFERPNGSRERLRKVSPVQTKRGAEQYERELRQALLDGRATDDEAKKQAPLLSAFADEFVGTYAVSNNKPSEVESKRSAFKNHLIPALGSKRLDQIGPREIEAFKSRKLTEGLSPKTVNNFLTMLRKLLAVAVEWNLLSHVPPVKWLIVPEPAFDFFTFEEAERLIASASPDARPMIVTAAKTGLRLGELLALRWEDVDLKGGRLLVRQNIARGQITTPKNHRKREVPLGDLVLATLRAHRHLRSECVFAKADGARMTKGEAKWPLWQACKRAGLRLVGWHMLRHTFASHLVMRGAPLKGVQELLGHSTMEMTMRYAHLSPDARRDYVKLLDVMVGEAAPSATASA
jgi:integrase